MTTTTKINLADRSRCPRCIAYREVDACKTEAICKLDGIGYYNATRAEALVNRRRRKPETLTAKEMRHFISEASVFAPHCLHVNTRKFCIIGTYLQPATDVGAADEETHFMLDGCHRAYMRSSVGKSTKVYILTLEETKSVYLGKRAPKGKRWVQ